MADELVEVLEKQAHICRTSKTIGLITKARSADAMQRASARIQSDAAEIARLRGELADARVKALEEAAKVADDLGGGRVERNPDGSLRTYDMNCKHDRGSATLNAMRVRAHTIAQAIRALSDAQGHSPPRAPVV